MKKNIIIVVLSLLVIVFTCVSLYLNDRLSAAKSYIDALESDYPEYIDTTSGVDAYSKWYNN